jgi:hypothetical protein
MRLPGSVPDNPDCRRLHQLLDGLIRSGCHLSPAWITARRTLLTEILCEYGMIQADVVLTPSDSMCKNKTDLSLFCEQ